MDPTRLRILLVENTPAEASPTQVRLATSTEQFEVTHVTTLADAIDRLRGTSFDAALLNLSLPDSSGIDGLERITATDPHLPIIVLTGPDDEAIAVEAIRKGAQDYLVKGQLSDSLIIRAIRYARERKHAEDSLRTSEATFRTHVENSFDVIFTLDKNGTFLFVSPAWERHFGFPVRDVQGKSFVPFVHPDDIAPCIEYLGRVLSTGQGGTSPPYRVKRADGEWRWFIANGTPYVDTKGEVQFIGVGRDITEQRRLEEKLRTSERIYRLLAENIGDVIWAIDFTGRYTYLSPSFQRLMGYTPEEGVNLSIDDLLAPSSLVVARNLLAESIPAMKAGQALGPFRLEIEQIRKDGSSVWTDVTVGPMFDESGQVIAVQGVTRDCTERRRMEKELRDAKEAAESANRAKSIFLASMSHELRTPLNAVLGFSQLMRTDPTLNESQRENLDIINRSGTHLLGLINDVLEMSRIEAGRVATETTSFDLWNTLDTIKDMVRSRAKDKCLRFILMRDPTLPRYIRTDERKLKQVIINLAGNAVKFTHHGKIILRARAENNGDLLRFEVEDTGPGIDAQVIPTLFEPFVQEGQSREGTGLGLFISKKLVEFLGGQITVRSEKGKGSLFAFDIRCEPVTAAQITSASTRRVASLAPGRTPPRVLVVEDTPDSRLLMTKTLRSTGFEVIEAANGSEALQLFEERQPDLVLMDMRMPVMNGYEAIKRIRATQQGRMTPIIAVTASAFAEDRHKILALGANDFVSKPMQAAELFEKIRLLLGIAYIYADEQTDGAAALDQDNLRDMIARLPKDLTSELAHAMTILDLDGFRTLLPKVVQHNPILAEKLHGLANNYRVAELAALLP